MMMDYYKQHLKLHVCSIVFLVHRCMWWGLNKLSMNTHMIEINLPIEISNYINLTIYIQQITFKHVACMCLVKVFICAEQYSAIHICDPDWAYCSFNLKAYRNDGFKNSLCCNLVQMAEVTPTNFFTHFALITFKTIHCTRIKLLSFLPF